jgi:hypothetical protein
VADEGVRAVRSYDSATGHFLGDVLTDIRHDGQPVGLTLRGDVLFVGCKKADQVIAVDLTDGSSHKVIGHKTGGVRLRHPAGLAFGPDGGLYVASHDGFQLLRYDLDDDTAEVFVDRLPDAPEHLLVVS